jgi:hypothetical protein
MVNIHPLLGVVILDLFLSHFSAAQPRSSCENEGIACEMECLAFGIERAQNGGLLCSNFMVRCLVKIKLDCWGQP